MKNLDRRVSAEVSTTEYLNFKKLAEEGKFDIQIARETPNNKMYVEGFYSEEYMKELDAGKAKEPTLETSKATVEKVGEQAKIEQTEAIEKEVEWDNHFDTLVDDEMKNGTGNSFRSIR